MTTTPKIQCRACKTILPYTAVTCPKCGRPMNSMNAFPAPMVRQTISPMAEYRRTCRACGKVWHSLVSREKEITNRDLQDALTGFTGAVTGCQTCGMCGTSTMAQADRNRAANKSELQRLKSCPNCSSANYTEELVEHVR